MYPHPCLPGSALAEGWKSQEIQLAIKPTYFSVGFRVSLPSFLHFSFVVIVLKFYLGERQSDTVRKKQGECVQLGDFHLLIHPLESCMVRAGLSRGQHQEQIQVLHVSSSACCLPGCASADVGV